MMHSSMTSLIMNNQRDLQKKASLNCVFSFDATAVALISVKSKQKKLKR